MKVDGAIRSLLQGVSQQPARKRHPGQGELQENMSSSASDGLKKRPPTKHIAKLFSSAGDVTYYEFELSGKTYIACFLPGSLKVFDLDGVEYDVDEEGNAFSYLSSPKFLRATTLEDTTYITDTSRTVKKTTGSDIDYAKGSIVYVLGGQYGRTYEWVAKDVDTQAVLDSQSFTTPNGGTVTDITQVTTDYIATQLQGSSTRHIDHLFFPEDSYSEEFTVEAKDGDHGAHLVAINGRSPSLARIPKFAPHGYIVEIRQGNNADAHSLYLRFQVNDGGEEPSVGDGFGREGGWWECPAPGIDNDIDVSTMPHVLEFDGTKFTLSAGKWLGRQVGNEKSNEDPSFIGRTINWISYFQGRLTFISGLATVMSRTRDPFDFWMRSATTILDDDPIDIESTAKNVERLEVAVPFNRDLVIFAKNAQFIVFGRTSLTPRNASLVLTTTFECALSAVPVSAGKNVFYGIQYGRFTGIREFFAAGDQDNNDSRPTTEHVSRYMLGQPRHMAVSENFSILAVQTDVDDKKMYVYEYLWANDQKVQASWSTWIMYDKIDFTFFEGSRLYIVLRRGDSRILEVVDIDTNTDDGLTYQIHLDSSVVLDNVGDSFPTPWEEAPDYNDVVIVQGEGCRNPGLTVRFTESSGTIHLDDDMEGGSVHIGVKYRARYMPTMPIVKDEEGVPIGSGVLRLSKFLVNFRQTGEIDATVTSKYTDPVTVTRTGYIVNDPSTRVGEAPIADGTFVVPVRERADWVQLELSSEHHTPMNFLDLEWLGTYHKRGTRIPQGE